MTIIEAYGKTYSAGDVKVNLLGRTIVGISKIKYGTKQKKSNEKGMSRRAISRKRGEIDDQCAITFKSWEMDAIQASAPFGDINAIQPFDVVVSYLDDDLGLIKTDVIRFCEFTEDTREIKGGDDTIESECELIVGSIDRNV